MKIRKIMIINAEDQEREVLRNLMVKESFEIFDFDNSMTAILWIKKNGAPAGLLMEEQATPLDACKTIDYLREELKMDIPVLITVNPQNSKANQDLPGYIVKPFTENTVLKIKDFFEKTVKNPQNEVKTSAFSLQYLKEIYDGNEEMILESLTIFKNSVADELYRMQGLLSQHNYEEISKVAHKIKPSFEMVDNRKGKELCHKLIQQAKGEDVPQMVNSLNTEFIHLDKELQNYFSQITKEYS